MANRPNVKAWPSLIFAAFAIFRVPGDGDMSLWGRGVAVEEGAAPLAGVVIVRHDYVKVPFKGRHCGHVASDISAADGRFTLLPWYDFWAADQHLLIAYRKGYVLAGVSENGFRLNMRRHRGDAIERLQYLDTLVMSSACLLEPSRDVVRLLELIVAEEEEIATDDEQRSNYVALARDRLASETERVGSWKERP